MYLDITNDIPSYFCDLSRKNKFVDFNRITYYLTIST